MSTETAFSPLAFPSLGNGSTSAAETEARTRGHAAGYAAGMRAAEEALRVQRAAVAEEHAQLMRLTRERADALLAALTSAVDAVSRRTVPVLERAQQTLAAASLELAEAIIGVELSDSAISAKAALTRVLADTDPALVLTVRMHPETLAALDSLDSLDAAASGVAFRADATLAPGDAIADYANGYLDAQIATAVARTRVALLEGPASVMSASPEANA